MSDRVGIKPKDNVNKKFSSLNLNQTYKGTKVEPKATTGVSRHGLQSLGKVAVTRRMPPPANLPSLKSENLGNDPTVALVPSGGGGWGSGKEKDAGTPGSTTAPTPHQGQAAVNVAGQTTQAASGNQQPALPPSKASEASQKPTATTTGQQANIAGQTTTNQSSAASTRTWANSSNGAGGQERTSYPHASQYFNREFPTLGGGNLGDRPPEGRGSHQPYGQPPRNMHDPAWADKGVGGPPSRPPYGPGNQGPPPRGYDPHGYHRDGYPPGNHSRPESNGTFPYMGQSRPPNYTAHPSSHRNHPGPRIGTTGRHAVKIEDSSSGYTRPSILKDDDIRAMDAGDLDDGGWAGAQEEIDYSVKLNFDDDEPPSPIDEKRGTRGEHGLDEQQAILRHDDSRGMVGAKPAPRQAWARPSHGENQGHEPHLWQDPGQHNQKRLPWSRASGHHQQPKVSGPPGGMQPHGRPYQHDGRRNDYQSQVPPMSPDRNQQREQQRVVIEQARQRKEQEELERRRHQEAATQEKLKMLDAKKGQLHIQTHENAVRDQSGPRSPLSPAGSDTHVRRIMRRKDSGSTGDDDSASVKSVESVGKEEKKESRKPDQPPMRVLESREQGRKTSLSDAMDDGKFSRLQDIKEERKEGPRPKERSNEKPSVDTSARSGEREQSGKTSKPTRQTTDIDRRKPRDEATDVRGKVDTKEHDGTQGGRRDTRKRVDESDRRREISERRNKEDQRWKEDGGRKESQNVSQDRNRDGYDDRKEVSEKKSQEYRNERGSSESLPSGDQKRDDRKRDDAMKRKREDVEKSDATTTQDRGIQDRRPRERPASGRGRPHLAGGKSSLRGHPKSYSHGRTDRRNSQRSRNNSKDYGDEEDSQNVPAEEKRQVREKAEERHQTDNSNRREGSQDTRPPLREKGGDRQSRNDRGYKGSGRFPPRGDQASADRPGGRASGRFPPRTSSDQGERGANTREKPRNRGGFGIPQSKSGDASKKETTNKKSEGTVIPRDQQSVEKETKSTVSTVLDPKVDKKEAAAGGTVDASKPKQEKETRKESSTYQPLVTNAWAVELNDPAQRLDSEVRKTSDSKIEVTKEMVKPVSNTRDVQRPRKTFGREENFNRQETKQRVESRDDDGIFSSGTREAKVASNEGDRRERGMPSGTRRQETDGPRSGGFPKRDSKHDERPERAESRGGESRRKPESKFDENRDRGTQPRADTRRQKDTRKHDGRSRTEPRGEGRQNQESKGEERRERGPPRSDSKPEGGYDQEATRYEPETKVEERRYKTEENIQTQPASQRDLLEPNREEGSSKSDKPIDQVGQRGSDSKPIPGNTNDRFTMGSAGPEKSGSDRRRYKESKRGGSTPRRGGRGFYSARGRGRGRVYGSGRLPGRGSTASKDDEDDSEDSGKYHSAQSLVISDESGDDTDVFTKSKADVGKSYGSGGHTRGFGLPRGRGRGRGGLSIARNNRKLPPRFQKQDQARGGSRGRGKSSRGHHTGYSPEENWDETIDSGQNRDRIKKNFDDGPLPKKRSPGNLQDSSDDKSSGSRGNKPAVRSGQSTKRSSFLGKKQQEVVGGARKGGARSNAGPKSTFSAAAALGRNAERRGGGKTDSAQDLDDIPEPPKKNPRRADPPTIGIEQFDLTNIAGVIDIEDIPASENEPASPHSGFVEVKSKRTQKELRDRAREEEERKRREAESAVDTRAKAAVTHKANNQSKAHQTNKPPRFARNSPNQVPRGSSPQETVPAAVSPENPPPVLPPAAAPSVSGSEQKRVSPLMMMEKPSSPAPPPMFNAWTKPLSITPAKPQTIPSEISSSTRPDPLAVGTGKPTRSSHPKSEEPELQIQVTLPDTFQAMPNIESQPDNSGVLIERDGIKKGELETEIKNDAKHMPRLQQSLHSDKNESAANDKRPSSGKFTKPPRLDKNPPVKRNGSDGRKYKADAKEQGNERKMRSSSDIPEKIQKEKPGPRPSSATRSREPNKNSKPKPQVVKVTKTNDTDEESAHLQVKNSQENMKEDETRENLNKRDSAELDVRSMSESLLDEPSLDVGIVETSESTSGPPAMGKIKTEDEINMAFKMEEKMVAAKKAWDDVDSVASSTTATGMVVSSPNWKSSSVSESDDVETSEALVMDNIPPSADDGAEENAEPLVSSPTVRLKKPTSIEQQNVCKVKPQQQLQQQQTPVKAQPVNSDVGESEFPVSSSAMSRSRMELQTQASYAVTRATVFPSKMPQYQLSIDQQNQLLQYNQYVQQQQHASTVRPGTLQPSQSPPQHTFAPSITTPSPLSQPTVITDTYHGQALPGTLYPTNFPNNQYYPIPVVRPAAPPQQSYLASTNEDGASSVYALQNTKPVAQGYDPNAPQSMFVSLDQRFVDQSQRPPNLGFYADNSNQASLGGNISHVPPTMQFPQPDKRGQQQHSRDSQPSHHHDQQAYQSGPSEMVKHVNAKPFQPPTNVSPQNTPHMLAPGRHMSAMPGQSNVSPAYQLHSNPAVVSMAVGAHIQGSSTVTTHSSSVVTHAHTIPVSRLGFQFPSQVPATFPRHAMPVQSLTQPPYPTGLQAYRPSLPTYPSASAGNQPGMLVQKSFPPTMVRQIVTSGRGAPPLAHRMPEPIQRPSKPVIISGNPKDKVPNPQPGQKIAQQPFGRRAFNPMMQGHQVNQPPPGQQQMFRSQQHQIMLNSVQQFFADEKQMEMQQHRKYNQDYPKRDVPSTNNEVSHLSNQDKRKQQVKPQETKPQKSKKDDQKKSEHKNEKRNTRPQERKDIRTAQIQPQRSQIRPQNRAKPNTQPKQQPVKPSEKLKESTQIEQKTMEKIETVPESKPEAPSTPLVSQNT